MNVEPGLSEEIMSENSSDSWGIKKWHIAIRGVSGKLAEMRGYIKSAGVYALSSIVIPLVSLVLAPFLTHALSTAEYGILTLLNVVISLGAGISQLGLSSAFFRAYNYDYTERNDRQSVVITTTTILLIVSLLLLLGVILTAPYLAQVLFGHPSFGPLVILAGVVIFVQNMTIPVFSWLRAENRAFYYSILSISNVFITLAANIVLVGVWHWRIAGAVVATASGYFSIVFIALPFILFHTGFRIKIAIARNLLGFGIPLIFGFVSYWILQISDRYLLSYFTSPAETAKYAVAYTLGTANSVVVIAPFLLIWPMTMYSVAKKEDAQDIYRQIFRWLGLLLLSVSFCLSFVAVLLLNWLFPPAYHSAAPVIPVVSASSIFYALYYIFSVGINIKRKMWLTGIYLSIAALVNFLLNLALIPLYGAIGAAFSTLIAYIVLAMAAYIVNQRVYPIPFELGRFVVALLIGVGAYSGCVLISRQQGFFGSIAVYSGTFLLYTFCLCLIGLLPAWKWNPRPMMLERKAS
jgi:O-antigen/teichoic acid export membrane protein